MIRVYFIEMGNRIQVQCKCDVCSAEQISKLSDKERCPGSELIRNYLRGFGWKSRELNGHTYDFCSEQCETKFLNSQGAG